MTVNLEPIKRASAKLEFPSQVLSDLTNLGRELKRERGIVFAEPVALAVCELLHKYQQGGNNGRMDFNRSPINL